MIICKRMMKHSISSMVLNTSPGVTVMLWLPVLSHKTSLPGLGTVKLGMPSVSGLGTVKLGSKTSSSEEMTLATAISELVGSHDSSGAISNNCWTDKIFGCNKFSVIIMVHVTILTLIF